MRPEPGCVRCGGALTPPGLMSSAWECAQHGAVAPVRVITPLRDGTVVSLTRGSRVPVWQLAPPPVAWTLGGLAVAGDERAITGVALGWSGPSPRAGRADVVVVAEEPGVGLGAQYAGLPGVDAGEFIRGAPDDHVALRGHPVALWCAPHAPPDRLVLVGEADGAWLWLIVWPATADAVLAERLTLADAREWPVPQPCGAAHPRLALH